MQLGRALGASVEGGVEAGLAQLPKAPGILGDFGGYARGSKSSLAQLPKAPRFAVDY